MLSDLNLVSLFSRFEINQLLLSLGRKALLEKIYWNYDKRLSYRALSTRSYKSQNHFTSGEKSSRRGWRRWLLEQYGKGSISFGLVNIPIRVFSGTQRSCYTSAEILRRNKTNG